MKKFAVDMDITMSKRIYVDAENEEEAETIVNNWVGDDPYFYAKSADAYVGHEISDVYEEEEDESGSGEKTDFGDMVENLEFSIQVGDTQNKTCVSVADEIREQIRAKGWSCLDDTYDEEESAREWAEENSLDVSRCEWFSICELDFLCNNDGLCERMCSGHDVDWSTFSVSFYGIWGEDGVFCVKL